MANKVRHETCPQYVARRLSEGWKIVSQEGFNVVLQSPDGLLRPVDLRYDTEEQTTGSYLGAWLYNGGWVRSGQKLTISNRIVSKLGFWLCKAGSPSGNITFSIRKVSDDDVIVSGVWGNASSLNTTPTYREVTFGSPTLINEEVRILVEFGGGNSSNPVKAYINDGDVKADENMQQWIPSSYSNYPNMDYVYIYTYTPGIVAPAVTTQAVDDIGLD